MQRKRADREELTARLQWYERFRRARSTAGAMARFEAEFDEDVKGWERMAGKCWSPQAMDAEERG